MFCVQFPDCPAVKTTKPHSHHQCFLRAQTPSVYFMAMKDTLLSLDLGFKDCLYRICRDEDNTKRVVYVVVEDLSIIPDEYQTCGPDVIQELSRLKEWHTSWSTLIVSRDDDGSIQCQRDALKPHALSEHDIVGSYKLVDILEFQIHRTLKPRVFRVEHEGKRCYLKIARFGFELPWLGK